MASSVCARANYIAELVTLHVRKDAPAYTIEQLTGAAPRRQGRPDATEENPAPTVESLGFEEMLQEYSSVG